MKDRNIINMITSIISAVIVVIFIPLLIVRYVSISKLGIIFFFYENQHENLNFN